MAHPTKPTVHSAYDRLLLLLLPEFEYGTVRYSRFPWLLWENDTAILSVPKLLFVVVVVVVGYSS